MFFPAKNSGQAYANTSCEACVDGYPPTIRKLFAFTTILMLTWEIVATTINPLSVLSPDQHLLALSAYTLLPASLLLYFLSYSNFVNTNRILKQINMVHLLRVISLLLFHVYISIICFCRTRHAINSNSVNPWLDGYTTLTQFIYIIPLVLFIAPSWYLKLLMVLCYNLSILAAYSSAKPSKFWWLILKELINILFATVVMILHSKSNSHISKRAMTAEDWNAIYRGILDQNLSYLAVIGASGELVYCNKGFKEATHNDMETFMNGIINLKLRDPFGNYLQRTSIDMGSTRRKSILQSLDSKFLKPKTIIHRKISTKDTRSIKTSFLNLKMLVTHYRQLLAENLLTNDDQILFDGKIDVCASASGFFRIEREIRSGSSTAKLRHTLSFEVIIRPLVDYQKLVIVLNDTTDRDVVVALENNSDYKDRVLASVSHQLRTPLNWNLGFLQTAMDNDKLDSETKTQFITPAYRSGKILSYVIDDILDYSHMETEGIKLSIKEKPLIKTLEYCLDLIKEAFKAKNLELNLKINTELPELFRTDHERLIQLLLNLLINALKFTTNGGVTVEVNSEGDSLFSIKVKDTGIGMSHQNITKLLKDRLIPDKSSPMRDSHSKGVGLGLKIAHKIGQLLEGNNEGGLQIRSEFGLGSTFSFTVKHREDDISSLDLSEIIEDLHEDEANNVKTPLKTYASVSVGGTSGPKDVPHERLHDEILYRKPSKDYFRIKRAHKTVTPRGSQPNKSKAFRTGSLSKILIVDDDPFNILVLSSLLRPFNISSDSAHNGQEAIQKVFEKPYEYKLIFMDCQMPIMDGFETTKTLQQNIKKGDIPDIPIVGCTAFSGQDKLKKCLNHGMREVIYKPVMSEEVARVIKKYVDNE